MVFQYRSVIQTDPPTVRKLFHPSLLAYVYVEGKSSRSEAVMFVLVWTITGVYLICSEIVS